MLRETETEQAVFLTGVTGNIGSSLAATILEETVSTRLILLVRAASTQLARKRVEDCLTTVCPEIDLEKARQRISVVCGDLRQPDLGLTAESLDDLRNSVTHIIHSAASTKFHSTIESAIEVNYQGTRRVLDLARNSYQGGRLQRFAFVSTAYLCEDDGGPAQEDHLPHRTDFPNSYEQSKWMAESLVRRQMSELPTAVFRPSTVVGDSRTGRIVSFNVMYTPIRLIWAGGVTVLPAIPNTLLDVVPVDYVSRSIWQIVNNTTEYAGKTFHQTAGTDNCLTVKEIVDRAVAYFNGAMRHQSLQPVEFSTSASGDSPSRAQRLVKLFAPYMTSSPRFDRRNCLTALKGSGIEVPHLRDYLDRVLAYCLAAQSRRAERQAA